MLSGTGGSRGKGAPSQGHPAARNEKLMRPENVGFEGPEVEWDMDLPISSSQHHPRHRHKPGNDSDVPVWKKFAHYSIEVDENQDDKAVEILLCSFARPHMRAFHCAWWSFIVAFFIWFAVIPLLPYMQEDLGLTKQDVWTSNIAGVASTILVRLIVGPLCDVYGARILFAAILCLISVPTACIGLVQTHTGLTVLRSVIGIAGATFVPCEYWCSRMFAKQVVGTANGLSAGWGNLGAGITNLVIGSILMPIFTAMCGGNTELAWRTVSIVPAITAFVTGIVIYRISDDSPRGNFAELKEHRQFPDPNVTTWSSWWSGSRNWNTWIMSIQYACSFGVELSMTQASALYFKEVFGQSTEASLAIASIFGWLNLFARPLGGFISDWANFKWGMRGRLWTQTLMLIGEGAMVFVFSHSQSLAGALVSLVVFSIFVQATDGTNLAIVPYIDPRNMGTVIGITGAGGNVGAVAYGLAFRQLTYDEAFLIMGASVFGSSLLSIFINIPGHACLLWGRDRRVNLETGELLFSSKQSDASGSRGSGRSSRDSGRNSVGNRSK